MNGPGKPFAADDAPRRPTRNRLAGESGDEWETVRAPDVDSMQDGQLDALSNAASAETNADLDATVLHADPAAPLGKGQEPPPRSTTTDELGSEDEDGAPTIDDRSKGGVASGRIASLPVTERPSASPPTRRAGMTAETDRVDAKGRENGAELDATEFHSSDRGGSKVSLEVNDGSSAASDSPSSDVQLHDVVEALEQKRQLRSEGQAAASGNVEDYELMEELGRGGMGVVYKARHRKLNRVVALKMILAGRHAGAEALQRFVGEARAVARLQHPGIVQIFDIGEHQGGQCAGLPYFSLEFVPGKDLHKDLAGQPRDAKSSAAMVERLALTMQYAHDHGVLHRDLKPANVLLDGEGNPKISDFGLAKQVDGEGSGTTSDGTLMGSPSYMPPEQARGELSSITPRSDLYSLGAILYQMLTGRPPFMSDRPMQTVMQVIHNEPVAPRQLQPDIPVDIETICMKALQKDASARYANCAALAADLRRFLNGEPILARPISRTERAWRWCRRNPLIAIPSTLAGMLVLLTAIISSWAWYATSAQAFVIAQERDNVSRQKEIAEEQRAIAVANEELARKEQQEADRQRTLADQQRAVAEENEEIARTQANLALKNIQFVVTEIDQRLVDQPGMSDIRLAIMEAVSKRWDELDVQLTGGIRGEAVPTLMALRQKIGTTFLQLDKLQEADAEFAKLHRMGEERIALKGRTDSARTNLAKIGMAWAPVQQRLHGDPAAAIRLLEQSADLVRETLRDPQPQEGSPSRNDILELLGAVAQNLGVEHLRQGRLPETAAAFQEALQANADVLQNIRSQPDFADLDQNQKDTLTAGRQISHDKSAIGLAYIQIRRGQTDEAIALYDKAIAGRREIFERRPNMLPLRLELAGHLGNYGHSLLWINRLDDADPLNRESLQLHDDVYKADPEKADHKRMLTTALYRMATLRDLQGHADESLSLFERCRGLRADLYAESPDEKNAINLMLVEARLGNVDQSLALSEKLAENEQPHGERHLERARALAQLTRHVEGERRQAFQDQALDALEQAIAEGFSDPFRIRAEQDLTPLRELPRFRLAVAELQADLQENEETPTNQVQPEPAQPNSQPIP